MASMTGALGGTSPWEPWPYDGRTRSPSMRRSSASGEHPQAPVVTATTNDLLTEFEDDTFVSAYAVDSSQCPH